MCNYRGNTALHEASDHSHVTVVMTLLHGGADPTIRNKQTKTALNMCKVNVTLGLCHILSTPHFVNLSLPCEHILNKCCDHVLSLFCGCVFSKFGWSGLTKLCGKFLSNFVTTSPSKFCLYFLSTYILYCSLQFGGKQFHKMLWTVSKFLDISICFNNFVDTFSPWFAIAPTPNFVMKSLSDFAIQPSSMFKET